MSDTITVDQVDESVEQETPEVGFGPNMFVANAIAYKAHKSLVDAVSKYPSVEAAVDALSEVWGRLEDQALEGGGYTPDSRLNFGSDNASQIANAIMGRKTSIGATRKAFANLGK